MCLDEIISWVEIFNTFLPYIKYSNSWVSSICYPFLMYGFVRSYQCKTTASRPSVAKSGSCIFRWNIHLKSGNTADPMLTVFSDLRVRPPANMNCLPCTLWWRLSYRAVLPIMQCDGRKIVSLIWPMKKAKCVIRLR